MVVPDLGEQADRPGCRHPGAETHVIAGVSFFNEGSEARTPEDVQLTTLGANERHADRDTHGEQRLSLGVERPPIDSHHDAIQREAK